MTSLKEQRDQAVAKRDAQIAALIEHHKAEQVEVERACDQEIDRLRDVEGTGG
jgi:hypothetical protein